MPASFQIPAAAHRDAIGRYRQSAGVPATTPRAYAAPISSTPQVSGAGLASQIDSITLQSVGQWRAPPITSHRRSHGWTQVLVVLAVAQQISALRPEAAQVHGRMPGSEPACDSHSSRGAPAYRPASIVPPPELGATAGTASSAPRPDAATLLPMAAPVMHHHGFIQRHPLRATLAAAASLCTLGATSLYGLWKHGASTLPASEADPLTATLSWLQATAGSNGNSARQTLVLAYQTEGHVGVEAALHQLAPEQLGELISLLQQPSAQTQVDSLSTDPLSTDAHQAPPPERFHLLPPGIDSTAEEWTEALGFWLVTVVQVLVADPCHDLDGYINGPWRLVHPPSPRRMVTAWKQRLADARNAAMALLQRSPDSLEGADRVLADVYASAQAFDPDRDVGALHAEVAAIIALADAPAIGAYLCDSIATGMEVVLGLSILFDHGVLDAHLAASHPSQFYAPGHDDPACAAYLQEITESLMKAGFTRPMAAAAAPAVFDMEARLAKAGESFWEMELLNLAQVEQQAPGLPWQHLWRAVLGLPPEQALFIHPALCREIALMLDEVEVQAWREFLAYQHARRALPLLTPAFSGRPLTLEAVFRQLDDPHVGKSAISDAYRAANAPLQLPAVAQMFDRIKQQYLEDVEHSSFPMADRQVLSTTIRSAQLDLGNPSRPPAAWHDITSPTASYRANLIGLRQRMTADRIEELKASANSSRPLPVHAHENEVGTWINQGRIRLSPASLHGLPQDRDGRWGTWGAVLAHEVGHLINQAKRRLSPAGQLILERENQAIQQRMADAGLREPGWSPVRSLEENTCDLRGLSVARRAGVRQAQAEGSAPFDDQRFFAAYAQLWAAHPTPAQSARMLNGTYAPYSVRVNAAMQIQGFAQAFQCVSNSSSMPFDAAFIASDGTGASPSP